MTATCFGSSSETIFRLCPNQCYMQLTLFYRVIDHYSSKHSSRRRRVLVIGQLLPHFL
jgi:hypothetical protein